MVTVSLDKQGINGYILLQPNISLGWQANVRVFYFFAFLSLLVGLYFGLSGKWLVLPFSGLEILLFLWVQTVFFKRYSRREVIKFSLEEVVIEQGCQSVSKKNSYKRLWSKFHIENPAHSSLPKIYIRCHDQQTEIGELLAYQDKQQVIQQLKGITQKFKQFT